MKVVIPVAGIGSKLRPHTHTQPKNLVPIAGKPMLAHIVDSLIEGGINDFIFILGYLGEKIEAFIKTNYEQQINIDFVNQEPREGSGHALWSAKRFLVSEKEILIVLGDTVTDIDLSSFLEAKYSVLGVQKVSNPTQFGIAERNQQGFVTRLLEKPKIPKSNLALVGIYKISNVSLFIEALDHLIDSGIKSNGEYQLTEALMYMIEKGEKIKTLKVDHWFDCGRKETLLQANATLLNNVIYKNKSYNFPQTIVIPPVSIGEGCKISNSIIGPNVAIGDNTNIHSSLVKDSIIGSFSALQDVVLSQSIIGNDSSLKGLSQSLNIGDNAEINFASENYFSQS